MKADDTALAAKPPQSPLDGNVLRIADVPVAVLVALNLIDFGCDVERRRTLALRLVLSNRIEATSLHPSQASAHWGSFLSVARPRICADGGTLSLDGDSALLGVDQHGRVHDARLMIC